MSRCRPPVSSALLLGVVLAGCFDDAGRLVRPGHPLADVQGTPPCGATAPATCYYVDANNGNDANDGTSALPWKSFKNISTYYDPAYRPPNTWRQINPGDYIYVANGTYSDIVHPGDGSGPTGGGGYIAYFRFANGVSGCPAKFHVQPYPGHTPIFDPQAQGIGIDLYQSSCWELAGVTIRNALPQYAAIGDAQGGIHIYETNDVTIHDVTIDNTDGSNDRNISGLYVAYSRNIEVYRSAFHDNYARSQGGHPANSTNIVFFVGGNVAVHDNTFSYSTLADWQIPVCVKYKHAATNPADTFAVYNNVFRGCKGASIASGTANTHVHHNLMIGGGNPIVTMDLGGPTSQTNQLFEYNTIYQASATDGVLSSKARGFAMEPSNPQTITFQRNIVYDTATVNDNEHATVNVGTYMSDQTYQATVPQLHFDNNCYYNATGALRFNIGAANGGSYGVLGGSYDITGWRALGYDVTSTIGDPQFTDPANNDFTLIPTSPCAAMGAYAGNRPAPPANECATPPVGTIWCDDFEADRLTSYFEIGSPTPPNAFARTAGVGYGGSYGMKVVFSPGAADAGNLKLAFGRSPDPTYVKPVDDGTTDYRDVYWRAYLKNQSGWTGGGGGKFSRSMVLATANWAQAAVGHVWSVEPAPDHDYLWLDPVRGTDVNGNLLTTGYNDLAHFTWLGTTRGMTPLFDGAHVGQWYCIEAHMKLNDPGQSNGVLEYWINGSLEAQRTGLNFLGSYNAFGINAIFFENYWDNPGAPTSEERYWDRIIVGTQRIGCGTR